MTKQFPKTFKDFARCPKMFRCLESAKKTPPPVFPLETTKCDLHGIFFSQSGSSLNFSRKWFI